MSLSPGRGDRDGERERVAAVLGPDVGAGIDQELVRERRQRGEHPRAAHDDGLVRLADLVERDLAGRLLRFGLRAVDLRVHERVRRREVVVAHAPLVGDEVLGALLVAAPRPDVGAARRSRRT